MRLLGVKKRILYKKSNQWKCKKKIKPTRSKNPSITDSSCPVEDARLEKYSNFFQGKQNWVQKSVWKWLYWDLNSATVHWHISELLSVHHKMPLKSFEFCDFSRNSFLTLVPSLDSEACGYFLKVLCPHVKMPLSVAPVFTTRDLHIWHVCVLLPRVNI